MPTRHCSRCKKEFIRNLEYFGKNKNSKDGFDYICRQCRKELRLVNYYTDVGLSRKKKRDYRKSNPEQSKIWDKAAHERLRKKVFHAYGGCCWCCGESHEEFLEIHHVGGWGKDHRKEIGVSGNSILFNLKRRGFPRDGIEILCANCHAAKDKNGFCPHQTERVLQISAENPQQLMKELN